MGVCVARGSPAVGVAVSGSGRGVRSSLPCVSVSSMCDVSGLYNFTVNERSCPFLMNEQSTEPLNTVCSISQLIAAAKSLPICALTVLNCMIVNGACFIYMLQATLLSLVHRGL